ncbi:MAG: periplasmic heavy metal sensor [Nitrospinae bacterium]|nr:periplasmic heavy metal sensor [Nitrospinota bacterium]
MKRQKRRTLSTAVIAAVLSLGLAGAAAWAQSPTPTPPHHMQNLPQFMQNMMEDAHFGQRGHRGRRGMRGPRPYSARPLVTIALRNHEELKLTDDQVNRLKDIRDAFSKKAVKEGAEMKSLRIDLRRALDAEKLDLADVEKKIREISKMRVDLRIARLKAIQEGKSVLNDEQQKQLTKIARKRRGRGPGMHEQMFKGPGPGNQSQTY